MKKCFLIGLFIFFSLQISHAQEKKSDTLSVTSSVKKRANRAALLSAIVPGAGQVYNKSYWKVPVLYGGIALLVYFAKFNQENYTTYKDAYIYRSDNDATTVDDFPNYSDDDLLVRRDYYRRNRDLTYVIGGVVYVLNIIDAYVDAQLKDFDVSDDLTLRTHPYFNLDGVGRPVAGVTFCLKIRK